MILSILIKIQIRDFENDDGIADINNNSIKVDNDNKVIDVSG